jgi:hypothetical protein
MKENDNSFELENVLLENLAHIIWFHAFEQWEEFKLDFNFLV